MVVLGVSDLFLIYPCHKGRKGRFTHGYINDF